MRIRTLVSLLAILAVITGLSVYVALRSTGRPIAVPRPSRACTVHADGEVSLDASQMANAATIAAVGIRRGLPERAVVVALATALQESKLENLAGGDRDSVGLFQQRPSQGWGTAERIRDPRYAATRFYNALTRVAGWQEMRVTDAAQRVQRSAYPEAYERWADEAAVLTKALLGHATGAVACAFPGQPTIRGQVATAALTELVRLDWGAVPKSAGELHGLMLTARDTRNGWQYAHWLVAHANEHGVRSVRYDGLEWTAKGGTWTKVASDPVAASGHVVAEVYTG